MEEMIWDKEVDDRLTDIALGLYDSTIEMLLEHGECERHWLWLFSGVV